jgi:hypothetical protein
MSALLYQPNFYQVAEKFVALGAYVVPVEPEGKRCTLDGWQNKATRDLRQLLEWSAQNSNYNVGIVGKPEIGAVWGFDDDSGVLAEYETKHGPIKTYRTKTVSGGMHLLFRHNSQSIAMGNLSEKNEQNQELWSARTNNRYVISAGSVAHPHNDVNQPLTAYSAIDTTPPIEAPEKFIEWLKQRSQKSVPVPAAQPSQKVQVHEGGRNTYLTSRVGKAHAAGVNMPELLSFALQVNEQNCVPPLPEKEVRTICESIGKRPNPESGRMVFPKPPAQAPVRVEEIETERINPSEAVAEGLDFLPGRVLASTRLQDIFLTDFEPYDWPLPLALPALVTAASVVVPPMPRQEGLVLGSDDPMTNLYTALIADVNAGKSQVINWAATAIGIYEPPVGQHYFEGKWGSAEQMLKSLHKKQSSFLNKSVLINPDEWSHLFAKARIPDASFPSVMTTSFYKQNQVFTLGGTGGGREYNLNLRLSFIGGIVEDEFDTVFGAGSLGGLYDRFLFGRAPDGFKWNYQPCRIEQKKHWADWNLKPVRIDPSVYEVVKEWSKENPGLGRVSEICVRIAVIYASLDGRPEITGKDIEPLKPLALYQVGLRQTFRPNPGKNPDAVFANIALAWIQKHAHEWTSIARLKQRTWRVEQDLGPAVAVRSLIGLARSGRIELWLTDSGRSLPSDYTGPMPRIGLVRRVT